MPATKYGEYSGIAHMSSSVLSAVGAITAAAQMPQNITHLR